MNVDSRDVTSAPPHCPAAYAIDVDGTLVGRHGVPRSAWEALRRSRDRGVTVSLCTGRLMAGATAAMARRVDPSGLHVSQSGAVVSRTQGELIWSSTLTRSAVRELASVAGSLPVDLELYWVDGFGAVELTPAVRMHGAHLGVEATLLASDALPAAITSAVCLVRSEDWPNVSSLLRELPGLQVSPASTPWAPGVVFANITAAGASKGSALHVVAEYLGIPMGRLAMVGDGENDVDALQAAGLAVVMGSAPNSVKDIGDVVVPDAEEGGLAVALAHLDKVLLDV